MRYVFLVHSLSKVWAFFLLFWYLNFGWVENHRTQGKEAGKENIMRGTEAQTLGAGVYTSCSSPHYTDLYTFLHIKDSRCSVITCTEDLPPIVHPFAILNSFCVGIESLNILIIRCKNIPNSNSSVHSCWQQQMSVLCLAPLQTVDCSYMACQIFGDTLWNGIFRSGMEERGNLVMDEITFLLYGVWTGCFR